MSSNPYSAAIGSAVHAAGTAFAFAGNRRAKREARKGQAAEDRLRRLSAARQRRSIAREAAQAAGDVAVATGGGTGVEVESSSGKTARSGLLNQLASNLSFLNQTAEIGEIIGRANAGVKRGQNAAALGGTIQSVGSAISST